MDTTIATFSTNFNPDEHITEVLVGVGKGTAHDGRTVFRGAAYIEVEEKLVFCPHLHPTAEAAFRCMHEAAESWGTVVSWEAVA